MSNRDGDSEIYAMIHQRFRHRRHRMKLSRARLLRSRDSYRVRELLVGVSDQIDRLVIGRLR